MRILIATDAAAPQVNGVVRTYERLAAELSAIGVEATFLTPADFTNFACPWYPEIRLAALNFEGATRRIETLKPDMIHIATEGPVGWMARAACLSAKRPFTTSYHTKFPEYASALIGLPPDLVYRFVRHFHDAGAGIMTSTPSLAESLRLRGFKRLLPWTRGVDTDLFRPSNVRLFGAGPVFLYVGRVSREKNIAAFLDSDIPGEKVVVGGGPLLAQLRRDYPNVTFTGPKSGLALAECYASADAFVFPSRTDTFGLVLLEAMASGLPVAAYPVTGPLDVIKNGVTGVLDDDLAFAATEAVKLKRDDARAHAATYSWRRVAELFVDNITTATSFYGASDARAQNRLQSRDFRAKTSGVKAAVVRT